MTELIPLKSDKTYILVVPDDLEMNDLDELIGMFRTSGRDNIFAVHEGNLKQILEVE